MPASPPLTFQLTRTGLVPADAYTGGELQRFKLGAEFKAAPLTRRSNPQNGLYWSILREVVDGTGDWPTPKHLHDVLKMNLGFVTEVKTMKGKKYWIPDSSAFDKMSHEDFGEYFTAAMAALTEYLGADVMASYYEVTNQNGRAA